MGKVDANRKETQPKSTSTEVAARVQAIYSMLMRGSSRAQIIQYAADKWSISDRQADTYIQKAREQFSRDSQFVRDEEIGRALSRMDELYQHAFRIQDYKTCLQVLKQRSAMLGLDAPTKTQVSGDEVAPLRIEIKAVDYRQILAPLKPDDENE